MASVALDHVELHLREPLGRAGSPVDVRRGIRVRIFDTSGVCGVGEALPLPSAGTEPMHEVAGAVLAVRAELEGRSGPLAALLDELDKRLEALPATRCGFDVALHDLEARLRGAPLARCLAPGARGRVEINALLGAADTETCKTEAIRAAARGYRTLKLKLGSADPEHDAARVAAVRAAVGPAVRLRLDANGAWTPRVALELLERLAPLDIELLEQPTAPHDLDGLARVHAASPIPIAVDEALGTAAGRARLLAGDLGRVAIIKPMVLGGLRPAARLCRQLAAAGIEAVVTTTLDGPPSTAAALHLAAAHGSATRGHGLAACEHFDAVFPAELVPRHGRLEILDGPGLDGSGRGEDPWA